jgi:hypothetical protein
MVGGVDARRSLGAYAAAMADEGSSELHEPWARPPDDAPPAPPVPPPDRPYDIAAEAPTEVMPFTPSSPPVLFSSPPPPPPPPAAPGRRKWPASAKAMVGLLTLALLGAAGGLGYAWWKTNDDKKDLEKVTALQGQELTTQLDKANADLATAKSSLDAATKQATDLQGQLKSAQDEAAANKATGDALKALFPITAASVAPGLPGTYGTQSLSPVSGGCSVAPCPSVQLALTVESASGALTVSDAVLGRVPLQATSGGWTATGPVVASLQLQCAGAPQPTSFTLTLAPAAVALDAKNAPRVTSLAGTLLLSSVAVTAVAPAPSCPPGIGTYSVLANRT